jgi:hypothetical protein
MPRAPKVWLTAEQQDDFERFARSRTLPTRLVQRAQIVLQAAAGKADIEIAKAWTSPVKRPVSGEGDSWIEGSWGLRKTARAPDAPD